MINTFVFNNESETVRFIQLTDSHLFKHATEELLGINTQRSFEQVLTEIQSSPFNYEFILATGDLVQDSSPEGYSRFCQGINTLDKMTFWIAGNHDFQPCMDEWLNEKQVNLSPKKHILAGKYWQILLLDSQVYGVPHGELGQYQLDWLQMKLAEYPDRHSLIVLHHHLLSTHSAWLDQHNLRNAEQLADLLAPFKNVKGILHGHIHQQVDDIWNGYPIMATPSTCVQFKPDNNDFCLDLLQPGWREIELHSDGRIETQVKRIQHVEFLPNLQLAGY